MSNHEESPAPTQPTNPSLGARVKEFPVVQSATTSAKDGYQQLKQSNEYVASALGYVEKGVTTASAKAAPYVEQASKKLEKYTEPVTGKGHQILDSLETKYPIVKEPTEKVVAQSKEALNSRVAITKGQAEHVYTAIITAVKSCVPEKHGSHADGEVKDAVDKSYMGQIYDVSHSMQSYLYTCAVSSREYAGKVRGGIAENMDTQKMSAMLQEQSGRLQASIASSQAYILSNIPEGSLEKVKDTADALKQKAATTLDSMKLETLTSTAKELQQSLSTTISSLAKNANFKLPQSVQEPVDVLNNKLISLIESCKEGADTMSVAPIFSDIGKQVNYVWELLHSNYSKHVSGQSQPKVKNE